ncbi:glycoprotein [Rhodococcus sp. IEGM 1379]|uniref:glycoprotein n=1 Tax=Rhodococcus sp. IEGM 1379 TaxID=3047086 RepID=UPI0024B6EB37|nr:glycoprotein [Rhodococcus sp. IEGM 1379]MDI9917849.1 glycoprotein [Rhodococcus sp. IEGM 1379]
MRMALRRAGVAALVIAAVGLTGSAGVGHATPAPAGALPVETGSHTKAPRTSTDGKFLELSIQSTSPSTITTTSDPTVVVRGTVKNVGDRPVEDVGVRLQRAPAIDNAVDVRGALEFDQTIFDTVGEFDTVATSLDKGESRPFTLSLPLRSATELSLDITEPGVYPMLVNVNGTPEYGGAARLDDARFLLPVLGVPAVSGATATSTSTSASTAVVPPDTSAPVGVTMMWPLADAPKLVGGIPGSINDPIRLIDDELATELSDGGRLDALVDAVESATKPENDADGRVTDSLCLAIDPDLLITVENMTRGYLVVDNAGIPAGATHEGRGRDAAGNWLQRVKTLAASMCTTSVPFAQADLAAVGTVAHPELTATAIDRPADILDNILGVTSVRNFVWPDSGVLDSVTVDTLNAHPTTALVAASSVDTRAGDSSRTQLSSRITDTVSALAFDTGAAAALAATGSNPSTPSYIDQDTAPQLVSESRVARRQDALGALAWSALTPTALPRNQILAPPQLWSADADDATAVLSMLSTLIRSGLATPQSLPALLGRQPGATDTATLEYPERATEDGPQTSVIDTARTQLPRIDALESTLVDDPGLPLTPRRFTAPLREDLLRAMSSANRRDASATAVRNAERAASIRAANVTGTVDNLYRAVTVVSPGGVYTLASGQAPLLLVARNELPIAINVNLRVDAPPEMKISDIGPKQLPPRGSRQLTVPAEMNDSRKLVVNFSLTTTDGLQLGVPTSVTVRSNAYGRPLAALTATAGGLLLFLAGRRLWHRFRGQPDPADEGYEQR